MGVLAVLPSGVRFAARALAAAMVGVLVVGSTAAMAATSASNPTATAGAPGISTSSSVVVNGTVNPEGEATSWQVNYGTTPSLGTTKAVGSVGSGSADVPVTTTLSGLTAGATYYYQLVATNDSSGSGSSAVQTVAVKPNPTAAAATPATGDITTTTAVVNGTVDPGGEATQWQVQYGPTSLLGSITALTSAGAGTTALPITTTLRGLMPNKTYFFELVANNDSTGSGQSLVMRFRTVPNSLQLGRPHVDKGGNISQPVTIAGKGSIEAAATFSPSNTTATLVSSYGRAMVVARKGGRVALIVKPSAAARRALKALKRSKHLTVALAVTFVPFGGTANTKSTTRSVNGLHR